MGRQHAFLRQGERRRESEFEAEKAHARIHIYSARRRRIVETRPSPKDPGCGRPVIRMSGSSIVVDSEIGVTKAELGNKERGGWEPGTGMVTEASWINYVFLTKPPAGIERKADEPTVAMITKERVPDSFIDILNKRRPFQKLPPIKDTSGVYSKYPKLRDLYLSAMTRRSYCVDLHEDVLRQHAEKGFAEVGVDFTDGVKKIFILPQPQPQPQPQVMMMQQKGNGGGGRSKTTLVFVVSGFAIVFALLVVLLSCLLLSRVSVQV